MRAVRYNIQESFPNTERAATEIEEDQPYGENASACLLVIAESFCFAYSYLFPFLVLPLGLANFISNMLFGGFGIVDMLGGFLAGTATSSCIVLIRRKKWNRIFIAVPMVLVPGLRIATYLSYFLAIPYPLMALNLCIGQIVPVIVGAALVKALERVWRPAGAARVSDSRRADS